MAAVSVIEIELRDEAFKKFNALFDQYNEKLKSVPSTWQKVDKVLKSNAGTFKKLSILAQVTAEQVKQAETGQKKLTNAAQGTIRAFTLLAKSTGQVAKNILSATGSLMKWASLSGIASGLLGVGGLFGLSRLAESAGQTQITARGAGVSAGQLKAAQINYAQLLGGEGGVTNMLEKIAQMQADVRQQHLFKIAGLSEGEYKGRPASEVLTSLIPALQRQFTGHGGSLAYAESVGLTKFLDPNTLLALGKYSDQELNRLKKRYEQDSLSLSVGDKTLGQWANLNRTLSTSGQKIENVFLDSLVSLTPAIEKLSNALSGAIKILADSPVVKNGLDKLGEGINNFAKYLTSDKFKTDMDDLIDSIEKLSKVIYGVTKFIVDYTPVGAFLPDNKKQYKTASVFEGRPRLAYEYGTLRSSQSKESAKEFAEELGKVLKEPGMIQTAAGTQLPASQAGTIKNVLAGQGINVTIQNAPGSDLVTITNAAYR